MLLKILWQHLRNNDIEMLIISIGALWRKLIAVNWGLDFTLMLGPMSYFIAELSHFTQI